MVASLVLGLPAWLSAQDWKQLCDRVATLQPGQWVQFEITGQPQMNSMRISHVGNEPIEGTTFHRYEMKMSGAMGEFTSQVLTSGRVFDMENVREMVVQMPGQPPMTMTGEMLAQARAMNNRPNMLVDEQCRAAKSLGRETVAVPMGNMSAWHVQTDEGDEAWLSEDVPGLMVKMVSKDGTTVSLAAHGNGAKATIQK
jgi:hypothetical protein